MELTDKQRHGQATLTALLVGLVVASVVACGDTSSYASQNGPEMKPVFSALYDGDTEGQACPDEITKEEISYLTLRGALESTNRDAALLRPESTCLVTSWCEQESDGACICYSAVGDCG